MKWMKIFKKKVEDDLSNKLDINVNDFRKLGFHEIIKRLEKKKGIKFKFSYKGHHNYISSEKLNNEVRKILD